MKKISKMSLGKLLMAFAILLVAHQPILASDDDRHELDNMRVTIKATEYKHSKFIETETIKGKEYITGKMSSYNREGEANAGILLQPCAEYAIKSKLAGGTYNVTVHYTIDKETAPENPQIAIGINTQKAQHIEIKNKLINTVKASFKVNFFKGKNHTVRVWFPSRGVKINEIKIVKAIVPKKG